MKLPLALRNIYRKSTQIPLIGPTLVAPILAFTWDTMTAIVERFFKPPNYGPVVSTYSSAIASLRMRVQALEARNNALAEEISALRQKMELQDSLEAEALDGLHRSPNSAPSNCSAISRRDAPKR